MILAILIFFFFFIAFVLYIVCFIRWEAEERRWIEEQYKEICARRDAEEVSDVCRLCRNFEPFEKEQDKRIN